MGAVLRVRHRKDERGILSYTISYAISHYLRLRAPGKCACEQRGDLSAPYQPPFTQPSKIIVTI